MNSLVQIKLLAGILAVGALLAGVLLYDSKPITFTAAQEVRRAQLKNYAAPSPKKYLVP